jgi:hypothetical protein
MRKHPNKKPLDAAFLFCVFEDTSLRIREFICPPEIQLA